MTMILEFKTAQCTAVLLELPPKGHCPIIFKIFFVGEENWIFKVFEHFLNWIPNVRETGYVQFRVYVKYLNEGVVPDADDDDNDV